MTEAGLITVLCERWEEARRVGTPVTPEELCRDRPDLLDEVRRAVAALAAADRVLADPVDKNPLLAEKVGGADVPASPPGYVLAEEVGRGGMGVVYRAGDLGLARDVAVKVLQDRFSPRSAVAARFVEEARITGQLQHPGIPAVHQVGAYPDGRPFLAMKLIKGRTFEELLAARPDLAHERGRHLTTFEAVCQAVGYAHKHRVIHRDLKPQNVMVGAFGEVQVMDWGLAKVLGTSPTQTEAETDPAGTAILARDDSAPSTQAGEVMGTPNFMPPEQAVGAGDQVDERSDVFGLGAILCVILTGSPPYVCADSKLVRLVAARGQLDDAFRRLDECGAEQQLVDLAKRCLAPDPSNRPLDALAVATEVAAYRFVVEERARHAEVERATAAVRVAEQRKRWRVLATLGMFVVAALAVAGYSWSVTRYRQVEADSRRAVIRVETTARVSGALAAARTRIDEAWAVADFPDRMEATARQADAAVVAAEGILASGEGTDELAAEVADARAQADDVTRHARLFVELDEALQDLADWFVENPIDLQVGSRMAAAFRRFGLDWSDERGTATVVARSRVRNKLLGFLCDTKSQTVQAAQKAALQRVIWQVRQEAGGVLAEWQAALDHRDLGRLAGLASGDPILTVGPELLCALYSDLESHYLTPQIVPFLRRAIVAYPQHPWLRYNAIYPCWHHTPPLNAEAFHHAAAAAALRPGSALFQDHLGWAYHVLNVRDQAKSCFEAAIRINPAYYQAHRNLGLARQALGDHPGARRAFEEAVRLAPRNAPTRVAFADFLLSLGALGEADRHAREGYDLDRTSLRAHQLVVAVYSRKMGVGGAVAGPAAAEQLTEAYRSRVNFDHLHTRWAEAASRQEWKPALDAVTRLTQLSPDSFFKMAAAVTHLAAGQGDEYRRLAGEMLLRYRPSPSLSDLERTAKTGLLVAPPPDQLAALTALADAAYQAGKSQPYAAWYEMARALAALRNDDWDRVDQLGRSARARQPEWPPRSAACHAIEAMAHFRRGREVESRASLQAADALIATAPAQPGQDWVDWAIARILTDEARSLRTTGQSAHKAHDQP